MSPAPPAPQDTRQALQALQEAFSEFLLGDCSLSFVVANPRLPDCPITFASPGFCALTQYSPREVLGRNCRFLQGSGTSRQAVVAVRDALREEQSCDVCLLNYRKDGTPFWNSFHLEPVKGADGTTEYYLGVQADVTRFVEAAAQRPEGQPAAAPNGGCLGDTAREEGAEAARIAALVSAHSADLRARERSVSGLSAADSSIPVSLLCAMTRLQGCFVLSDPHLPDSPIVYASPGFLRMTGYSCGDVLGRNCRFLQGPGTDQESVSKLHQALSADPPLPVTVTLLNYKKDGSPFFNCLHVAPVRDADGAVRFLAGCQLDVTAAAAPSLPTAADNAAAQQNGGAAAEPSQLQLLEQKGVVGAIRVATRALADHGLRREPAAH